MSAIDYDELTAQVAKMDREDARLSVVAAHIRAMIRHHVAFGNDGGVSAESILENLMDTLACPSDCGILIGDMDYVARIVDQEFDSIYTAACS